MATVELDIVAELDGVKGDLKSLEKSFKKSLDKIEKTAKDSFAESSKSAKKFSDSAKRAADAASASFNVLAGVAAGVLAAFSARALVGGINAVTDAAARQEDAVNNLNTALLLSGEFSEDASQGLQDFASGLQDVTRFGDEAILETLALAKSFGATNDQAKLVTEAAIEFAAASGKSLEEATRQVSKTLGGFAGELGEINPAIKALTAEQLKAGEAAKVLIDQYGGTAAAQVNTFAGATAQLSTTFGDLLEDIGFLITKSPAVIKAIGGLNKVFKSGQKFVQDNAGQIGKLVTAITVGLLKTFSIASKAARIFFGSLATAGGFSKDIEGVFSDIVTFIGFVTDEFLLLKRGFLEAKLFLEAPIDTALADTIEELAEKRPDLKGIVQELQAIDEQREKLATDTAVSIGIGVAEGSELQKQAEQGIDSLIKEIENIGPIEVDLKPVLAAAPDSPASPNAPGADVVLPSDPARQIVQELSIGDLIGESATALKEAFSTGADILVGSLDLFTDALSGGFITRIGEQASKFLEAPAQLGQVLKDVPKIFKNVSSSLLQIVDKFPEILEDFLRRFPKFFARAVASFNEVAPEIVKGLVKALPVIIDTLADGLVNLLKGLPKILEPLIAALPKLITQILQRLPEIILEAFSALTVIFEQLADVLPDIILSIVENIAPIAEALAEGLASSMPTIALALVDSLIIEGGIFRIAAALAKAFIIDVPIALAKGFINGIRNVRVPFKFDQDKFLQIGSSIASGITENLPSIRINGDAFFARLANIFNQVIRALESVFEFSLPGSGGGGLGGRIGGALGLQSGGTVPKGFPNDSFPASLTSGELVVPRDTVVDLQSFLANQGGGGGNNEALLRELISAVREGGIMEVSIKEDGLSEAILDANQRNERLTA